MTIAILERRTTQDGIHIVLVKPDREFTVSYSWVLENDQNYFQSPDKDLPSYVCLYKESNGVKSSINFIKGWDTHRDADKPSAYYSFKDGTRVYEYYKNGQLHRLCGPAIVEKLPDGLPDEVTYAIDGYTLSKLDFALQYEMVHLEEYVEKDYYDV